MRFVFIELPLVLLFALALSAVMLSHVHKEYFDPQFDLMHYTDNNRTDDLTFYHRHCTPDDLTTLDPEDLYIRENFTTDEKVAHILIHGMSIYEEILTEDTADVLRSWVLKRNKSLVKQDEIDVIANENRWSFFISVNENPIIAKALHEMATHDAFRPALERIVGRNPAIIEMTAITSAYGAEHQNWHHDIIAEGSPAKFARSFIPSYSLFMTLQDVTAEMGATGVCPGTHMCASDADLACADYGFQASGKDVWKKGSALLMNQQSFHRGAAHVDPNGQDRVLFIVTFAPRPEDALYETRMLGQGGSYSLRWDMWGHTLNDFENTSLNMRWPWTVLRALGLYKPKDADWGWDFISQTSTRISNGDTGYYDENLDDFVENGGFRLPKFLSVKLTEGMSWREYITNSIELCKEVMIKASIVGYGVFVVASLLISFVLFIVRKRNKSKSDPIKNALQSMVRVAIFDAVLLILAIYILQLTARSNWARAIKAKTLYTSPFSISTQQKDYRPLAVVSKNDILLTDRYDMKILGSLCEVVDYQGGNLKYKASTIGASKIVENDFVDIEELVDNILDGLKREGSRLLLQNEVGEWVILSDTDSFSYTKQSILLEANPLMLALHRESRFLLSSYKHGLRHKGAMARKHSMLNVYGTMKKLMIDASIPFFSLYNPPTLVDAKLPSRTESKPKLAEPQQFGRHRLVGAIPRKRSQAAGSRRNISSLPRNVAISEEGMMKLGDVVDVQYKGLFNEYYRGEIVSIREGSSIDVKYFDGEIDENLAPHHMTRFKPYYFAEKVEVKTSTSGRFFPAEITKIFTNEKVEVRIIHNSKKVKVPFVWIRRVKPFAVGDIVGCPFEGSEEKFRGTIVKENADGTFDVLFDDGDEEFNVHLSFLELWMD